MKALKFAALALSTALCCGATLAVSEGIANAGGIAGAIDGAMQQQLQAKPDDFGKPPETPLPPAVASPGTGTATADDIVVANGPATIRIRHVEVAGSSLSNTELAALFAIKDPKALEARLRTLDAASIVIPEIDGTSIEGATQVHFTQKDVLLANVKGGRAATGNAAAATVTFKDDKNETKVTTDATTFKGLDLAQIVHLTAGPRTDDSEMPRPVCDEIAIQTVTTGGAIKDGPPVAIATIRATGLKARPPKTDLNATDKGAAALN